jgi:hypothetical protein
MADGAEHREQSQSDAGEASLARTGTQARNSVEGSAGPSTLYWRSQNAEPSVNLGSKTLIRQQPDADRLVPLIGRQQELMTAASHRDCPSRTARECRETGCWRRRRRAVDSSLCDGIQSSPWRHFVQPCLPAIEEPGTTSTTARTWGTRRRGQHGQGQQNAEDFEIPGGSIPPPDSFQPVHTILGSLPR